MRESPPGKLVNKALEGNRSLTTDVPAFPSRFKETSKVNRAAGVRGTYNVPSESTQPYATDQKHYQ